MSLFETYQADIDSGKIRRDAEQWKVLTCLEERRKALSRSDTFFEKCFGRKGDFTGAYFYGPVGIGKTYLMDLFVHALPEGIALRLHFHAFMQRIHAELKNLEGTPEPLARVAKDMSKEIRVLCLDEFIVNDITDAMILANLLDALFLNRIMVVTTSNTPPDELYRNGLQRSRFLPAIELIKKHLEVMHVRIEVDYRLEKLQEAGVFFYPLDEATEARVTKLYTDLTLAHEQLSGPIEICERPIETLRRTEHIVWFNFKSICRPPRSQVDYLMIADEYDTVFVTGIPSIGIKDLDTITYFIHLVDVFYDCGVKLILSSAVPVEDLYPEGPKSFEFKRTLSRLQEMRSTEYLKRGHQSVSA